MRPGALSVLVSASLLLAAAPARAAGEPPLPYRMADTGGGDQLITAVAARTASTTGTLTWWDRRDGGWVRAGTAPARFGANGLADGATRRQGTETTPTGLYGLPFAFGTAPAPPGTVYPYRPVREDSWWCQDNASRSYNRWAAPLPADCRAGEAERLAGYPAQYAHALVVGFNYRHPVRGRGAGIFLHVDGRGATTGCVSVPAEAMRRLLRWASPAARPHIAIGTGDGATAVTRY
ncbi:L,D-transpeptidase family protein [Streptomyces sp. SHP 1-2]|uniref:L,D-transpeptidase family protein n=1 Tax=Streptomyces sp. SHP 1-2 TaxID=2769489 RepID=UPI00223723A9|nr:L,D-transpeptidase family protein [Streptomyces sp. SHP 1-2]MCW5250948.1 L,D-transpeptidase family protein [Streptomyces sp. SHP 1-2]